MKSVLGVLPIVATLALVVQLLTPWQILHFEMSAGLSGQDVVHAHCPNGQGQLDETQTDDDHDSLLSACERACGLTLNILAYLAVVVVPNLSELISTEPIPIRLYFSAVPKPPPII